MSTSAETEATLPRPAGPRYCWQVQAGQGQEWTDYGFEETQRLEEAWTTQLWATTEISVSLQGIAGWNNYVFHLGHRLQQVNIVTGTARNMRRTVVLQESRARATTSAPPSMPGPRPTEEENTQRSEEF